MNDYQELLKELRQQEEDVQFTSFSNDMALQVGLALREEVRARGKAVAIDITRNGQQLFHFAMLGTASDNGEWILISSHDYAAHGGAFPLIIRGVGVVGTITISGLPQQEDHEVVITTLKKFVIDKAS